MIKSWWFQLYTKTFLTRLGQLFLLSLGLDLAFTHFDPYFNRLAFLLPLVALVTKFTPGSFRENIEFHKMSVPFKDLREAFLLDVFLTAFSTIAVFYLEMGASHLLGGFFSTGAAKPFFDLTGAMIFYYTTAAFFVFSWVCFIAVDKKYVFYGLKHRTFWQKVFFLVPIWAMALIQMGLALYMNFQVELAYTFMLGSLFVGSSIFFLEAIFHKGPTHASTGSWFKHYALGFTVFSFIFGTSVLTGRSAVLDPSFDVDQKLTSYKFFGPFNPNLDQKSFMMIEPRLSYFELKDIYRHVAFNPSVLGVEYFLDHTQDHLRLVMMLEYGHPSESFLLSLFDHFGQSPSYWEKVSHAPSIRYHAFRRWPQRLELPERFLAEKKKADDFAELRKLKRLPSGR